MRRLSKGNLTAKPLSVFDKFLIVNRDSLFTLSQVIIQETASQRAIVDHRDRDAKNDPQIAEHDQTASDDRQYSQQVELCNAQNYAR